MKVVGRGPKMRPRRRLCGAGPSPRSCPARGEYGDAWFRDVEERQGLARVGLSTRFVKTTKTLNTTPHRQEDGGSIPRVQPTDNESRTRQTVRQPAPIFNLVLRHCSSSSTRYSPWAGLQYQRYRISPEPVGCPLRRAHNGRPTRGGQNITGRGTCCALLR